MRRIALSLSIVASLALLGACSGGTQGTGFSYTSSPTASVAKINFVAPGGGPVSNVFTAGGSSLGTPVQPVLVEGLGYNNGGGILGSVSVPSTKFRWTAVFAPQFTRVNQGNNGSPIFCPAGPGTPTGAPLNIEYQFAPTTSSNVPPNGDTLDPAHPGYAIAALDSTNTTVNYYNPIAFFVPKIPVPGPAPTTGPTPVPSPPKVQYCVQLLATAPNGVQGSAFIVVYQ